MRDLYEHRYGFYSHQDQGIGVDMKNKPRYRLLRDVEGEYHGWICFRITIGDYGVVSYERLGYIYG